MRVTRLLPAALAALLLSGCFGGAKAPKMLLDLTPERNRTAAAETSAPIAQAVVVALPTVPEELSVRRIPVRAGGSITYLKDAEWVDAPAQLFSRLVTETVAATGRVVLDSSETSFQAGIVLSGHLQSFGVDAARREAVVIYDAALAVGEDKLRIKRFEARVPLGRIDAEDAAPALNQAANQVAAEIAAWLGG